MLISSVVAIAMFNVSGLMYSVNRFHDPQRGQDNRLGPLLPSKPHRIVILYKALLRALILIQFKNQDLQHCTRYFIFYFLVVIPTC